METVQYSYLRVIYWNFRIILPHNCLFNINQCRLIRCIILVNYMEYNEYDQEIPQSQPAAKPMALRGRAKQQTRDTRKTN